MAPIRAMNGARSLTTDPSRIDPRAMANAKKKRSIPKKPADVAVPVDAKLKARWDATLAVVTKAKVRGASAFDELYEAVGAIIDHDPPLYVLGGFASVEEFAKEVLGEKKRSVQRNVRVARFASPRDEVKYGVTKLDAALALLEARAGKPLGKVPVAFASLRIPVKDGKTAKSVRFADATIEEINAATRATRASAGTSRVKKASQLLRALTAGLDGEAFASTHVHEANGTLSFTGVPIGALTAFVRIVSAAAREIP